MVDTKGLFDQVTGKAKEVAGDLLKDGQLKGEGLVDQVVGKAKEVVSNVTEANKDTIDAVKDKVENLAETAMGAGKAAIDHAQDLFKK